MAQSAATQVFVDDSGRRGRWSRRAGALLVAGALLYTGVVAGGLAGPRIVPVVEVPLSGNGVVPGLPAPGAVPGLLAPGGSQSGPSAVTGSVRRGAVAPVRPARSTGR